VLKGVEAAISRGDFPVGGENKALGSRLRVDHRNRKAAIFGKTEKAKGN